MAGRPKKAVDATEELSSVVEADENKVVEPVEAEVGIEDAVVVAEPEVVKEPEVVVADEPKASKKPDEKKGMDNPPECGNCPIKYDTSPCKSCVIMRRKK